MAMPVMIKNRIAKFILIQFLSSLSLAKIDIKFYITKQFWGFNTNFCFLFFHNLIVLKLYNVSYDAAKIRTISETAKCFTELLT